MTAIAYVSTTNAFVVLLIILALIWFTFLPQHQPIVNDVLSRIIGWYLVRKHPVNSVQDGQPIPTCAYRWPNGQGDVAKFLEGEKNSARWGQQYGGAYRLWSGTTPEIVLRNAADVQAVFGDSHRHTKAVNNNAGWLMGELLGKCLGLVSGEPYQRMKGTFSPPFTHQTSSTYLSLILRITEEYVAQLSTAGGLRQNLLDPVADLRMLPFRIVAELIYGELTAELKTQLDWLVETREALWQRMIKGGATRYWWSQYTGSQTSKTLREFKRRWRAFNDEAHKAGIRAGRPTLIASWYTEVGNGSLAMEELLQTADEMLFANLDVTMGAISWNILFLAANPEVQTQIREEAQHAKRLGKADWHEYLQSSSTLLAASILESSRLKPLAAFSVPQAAPSDRVVAGFLVPAGSNFIVDTYALNVQNAYWGADSEAYRPARFLHRKASEIRYQFWRFGFGPRQCLGRFVADLMLRALVAHLIGAYRLELSETTTWGKKPATWILQPDTKVRCEEVQRG